MSKRTITVEKDHNGNPFDLRRKIWWKIWEAALWVVFPLDYVSSFIQDFVWSYAWYKYGGGRHIGKNWTFWRRIKDAHERGLSRGAND